MTVEELITINDVEQQVAFDLSEQPERILQLIQAIREKGEAITRRALKPTTKVLTLDGFPPGRGVIEIPDPPLRHITTIKYYDQDGVEQTLSSTLYRVVINNQNPHQPSFVLPAYGEVWPSVLDDVAVVNITYVCGYGTVLNLQSINETINLPSAIKQWMLINIANLYENPETVIVGNANKLAAVDISSIADSLISNFRVYKW